MTNKEVSSFKIIMMGQAIVNLPVSIAIISTIIIMVYMGCGIILSTLPGTLAGWMVWNKMLERWKIWALDRGVDRERLFRFGKLGLINFYKYRIFDSAENYTKDGETNS